jgi:uridine kinase
VFHKIDVVLLEGIFLFKSVYRDHFDLKVWIECSFATALERAIARGQEGLLPRETQHAFETIYFPAQRIHLARDNPRETADIVFANHL